MNTAAPLRNEENMIQRSRSVFAAILAPVLVVFVVEGGLPQCAFSQETDSLRYGLLVPATGTMSTAWMVPKNPLTDSTLDRSPRADQIRWGYRLFMRTPAEAPQFTCNKLTCGNCHLNGGQREKGMPLVGISSVFPEYNKREGRQFSLEDRIVGCFMRSENGTGAGRRRPGRQADSVQALPTPASREVAALAAYISWISDGVARGQRLPWRGQNQISPERLLPIERLSIKRGKAMFMARCTPCHGRDGQGIQIGDKKAAPLWGPDSWNDGAGAARVYTLAGIIRYAMPYLNPGSLTDEEAQHIAAFINSMPRPVYPFKDKDYQAERLPPDAVYYKKPRP